MKKKLKLEIEAVRVDSFDTTPEGRGRGGTVFGQISIHCTDSDPVASNCCTPNATCPPTSFTLCTCDSEDDYTCGTNNSCAYTRCGGPECGP